MYETILAYIKHVENNFIVDLRALIDIDSGHDNKHGINTVQSWLADRLAALDFQILRYGNEYAGDDLVATLAGTGTKSIVLLGHSDTVYQAGTAASRPIRIEGDIIYGPGVCDMKGGLLCGVYALEALKVTGFTDYKQITYLSVSDEEAALRHSIPLIKEKVKGANAVLTLEAARANGNFVTSRKGRCWMSIEALGREAHAGVEPEKGRNAIIAMAKLALALDKLNGMRPGSTVNIGSIQGGTIPSVVPGRAYMRVDLRTFSQDAMEDLKAEVSKEIQALTSTDISIDCKIEEGTTFPPMQYTPEIARLEQLAQRAAEQLGFQVSGSSTGGASDASFAAAEGIAVLDGLGPIGGDDHSPGEYILKSSIVPRTAMLAGLIKLIAAEF